MGAGTGTAGSGSAGSGTAGMGPGTGTAGSGTAGSGTAGSGTAGSGTAGSGTAGSGTAGSAPQVVVSYVVDREWAGGFQGQVRVVNNGTRPITGWQAVIALPRDRVTWFWNASGFVSHHIVLLQPFSADEVVPAGGTLSVFFTATGPETTPQACAFDGIYCG